MCEKTQLLNSFRIVKISFLIVQMNHMSWQEEHICTTCLQGVP